MGSTAYNNALTLTSGPDRDWFQYIEANILDQFIGPDCCWRPPESPLATRTKFFGNVWWVPFPPTLVSKFLLCHVNYCSFIQSQVMRYDDGALEVLQDIHDMELYIAQNRSPHIQRRRGVRRVLRALEGQVVAWPYDHQQVCHQLHRAVCEAHPPKRMLDGTRPVAVDVRTQRSITHHARFVSSIQAVSSGKALTLRVDSTLSSFILRVSNSTGRRSA